MGKDHTIFAVIDGLVHFQKSSVRRKISVLPVPEVAEDAPPPADSRRTRRLAAYPPRGAMLAAAVAAEEAAGMVSAR